MYKDVLSKKVIDMLGNTSLSMVEKSWSILNFLHQSEDPNDILKGIKVALECCGLAPRHETNSTGTLPDFGSDWHANVSATLKEKIDHKLKGWFKIDADKPIEKKLTEICMFLEEFTDDREKAVAFQLILSSSHIPIPVNYFSRDTSEPSDDLILREYASEFIQLRQLLNLNVDPTSRGSLVIDFIAGLNKKPHAQAVVLGSFIEELLRRLRGDRQRSSSENGPHIQQSGQQDPPPFSATFPIDQNMDPDQLKDMINNFKSMLPPEVLAQLRKLFGDKGFDI